MATRRELLALADRLEAGLAEEFIKMVRAVKDDTRLADLERAIAKGDPGDVLRILGLDEARVSVMAEALRTAYVAGIGVGAVEVRKATRSARFSFNLRNPRVESFLRTRSAGLVTRITESQRETISEALARGMARGQNPRATALDIVGRKGVNGRRAGGIVGLTPQQASYVSNARSELLSLDHTSLSSYLRREARDKRFDRAVIRAANSGARLPPAQVARITTAYEDRLLRKRGEDIARTEVMSAISEARDESFEQAIEAGLLDPDDLSGTWDASGDARTRPSHHQMDGQVQPRGGLFVTPDGYSLAYPGDTSHGAPASETMNCRCILTYTVDYITRAAREARR